MHHFGYKSKYIRYLEHSEFHFEIFVPCLIDKTQRRVDTSELKALKFI